MAIAPSHTPEIHSSGIQIPLTTHARQVAQQFANQCPFSEKSDQIRLNTLAVCAVDAYLQLMEIPSAITQSDSWNPLMQMMANVADLTLPGIGSLSCRPIQEGDKSCHIPPEDWQNRVGYIVIKIDETANQATLLGFKATVNETEQVALQDFEPMEALIDEIHQRRVASAAAADTIGENSLISGAERTLTRLGYWIEGAAVAGWQVADQLINPAEMGFAFRTAGLATPETTTDVSRAKLIDLGIQLGQSLQVALVVHIAEIPSTQTPSTQATSDSASTGPSQPARSNIILQVRPFGNSPYLPEDLVLTIFDDQGASFMSTTSRAIDNYIQLRLSGESGEQFSIQIKMETATFEESFVI